MRRLLFLATLAVALAACGGSSRPKAPPTPTLPPLTLSIPPDAAQASSADFAAYYKLDSQPVVPAAPQYSLPLDLSSVVNLKDIESTLHLTAGQEALLQKNGFVVVPGQGDDIMASYGNMKDAGVPNFVTADTMLHLYHVAFASVLKSIEQNELVGTLNELTNAMFDKAVDDYARASDDETKEAARRNVAYFGVALELLQTPTQGPDETTDSFGDSLPNPKIDFTIPDYVADDVAAEIDAINKMEGFEKSRIFDSSGGSCPGACSYCEDYSQYQPRGYYTSSDVLRRYFKAMMWYGTNAFFLKGGDETACSQSGAPFVTEADAKTATIQAALIAAEMPSVKVGMGTAEDAWSRMYAITSFFVGAADDLTPYQYLDAIRKVFGANFDASALADDSRLLDLKAELASLPNPQINGGTGECTVAPPVSQDSLYQCLDNGKGMRFMGQRFVPDAQIQQSLVFPSVGLYTGSGQPFTLKGTGAGQGRTFARGLDVMAVLGSQRAHDILAAEGDTQYGSGATSYDAALAKQKQQFAQVTPSGWTKNLYWAWLYMLPPLLQSPVAGLPTFMQTPAWQDRELQSALASWTELRHDTILYAKQVMVPGGTGGGPPPPPPLRGYVEPAVDVYARMQANLQMVQDGLKALNAMPEDATTFELTSLEYPLTSLVTISQKELAGEELTQDDYDFITDFQRAISVFFDPDVVKTTLVADVLTDGSQPQQVLEEGTGNVDLMVVAYKLPDGQIVAGVGPVMSYYEFKQPLSSRLTDEAWRTMLAQGQAPLRSDWVGSFFAK
ncbi:MAG: DUF3160 domain-containing protein [Dehalococcoidia bacterium]|jgi:hypothetical protein